MNHTFSAGEIGLIITIITHMIGTVWWASKMNTTMTFIKYEIENVRGELEKRDDQIRAIWDKIDVLQKDRRNAGREPGIPAGS